MPERRYRVLLVGSHPVQYSAPLFRHMAQHPKLDIQVAYCSVQGAERGVDPGFGVEVVWDIPLLEGYPWVQVPNKSPRPGLERFWGLINPGLWSLARDGHFDAVVVYTGYACASFWIVAASAKLHRIPLIFGTDAVTIEPRVGSRLKAPLKRILLPLIFRLATVVIVPSSGAKEFIRSLGIAGSRIALTPYVVDNDWWRDQAARVHRKAVRGRWNVPQDAAVVLYCGKLQPWKRPQDVLRAFAKANISNAYLVFAGDGPLRTDLEAEAGTLQVFERVRFLGFVNQSGLPDVYRSADLFVLPSEYDAFGVVVNEAMLCGCPAVLSDRVGARFDLVEQGRTGFVYPCGDIEALKKILCLALSDRARLHAMGIAAMERMETWSWRENVEGFVRALETACPNREPGLSVHGPAVSQSRGTGTASGEPQHHTDGS